MTTPPEPKLDTRISDAYITTELSSTRFNRFFEIDDDGREYRTKTIGVCYGTADTAGNRHLMLIPIINIAKQRTEVALKNCRTKVKECLHGLAKLAQPDASNQAAKKAYEKLALYARKFDTIMPDPMGDLLCMIHYSKFIKFDAFEDHEAYDSNSIVITESSSFDNLPHTLHPEVMFDIRKVNRLNSDDPPSITRKLILNTAQLNLAASTISLDTTGRFIISLRANETIDLGLLYANSKDRHSFGYWYSLLVKQVIDARTFTNYKTGLSNLDQFLQTTNSNDLSNGLQAYAPLSEYIWNDVLNLTLQSESTRFSGESDTVETAKSTVMGLMENMPTGADGKAVQISAILESITKGFENGGNGLVDMLGPMFGK